MKVTTALAAAAALALTIGVAPAASAGTATSGVLTVTASDQLMRYGCYDYQNMTYTVGSADSWSLDVDIYKTGAIGSFDFAYGDGPGTGLLSAYLCDSMDGPGTYTVRAVLTSHDANYNALPNVEASTTFVLSTPIVTPPPPPPVVVTPPPVVAPVVKVATTTGIAGVNRSGDEIHAVDAGRVAYMGTRVRRAGKWLNGARVVLQSHRVNRPWSTLLTRTTTTIDGYRGMAIVKVWPLRTTTYRWVFAATATSLSSRSAAWRIRTR